MKVKRITLEGEPTAVTFEGSKCGKWLVKNFTEEDIFVSFEENFHDDEAIKIAPGMGQIVIENERLGGLEVFKHDTIYVSGTGEVEVQQLCYHN